MPTAQQWVRGLRFSIWDLAYSWQNQLLSQHHLADRGTPPSWQPPGVSVPTPPCPYLHPGFRQVCPQCQLLPGIDVGIMRLLENLLQLLQLERAEGRPVPPLLALALAQGLGELGDPVFPEAAQGCCQWAPQVFRAFGETLEAAGIAWNPPLQPFSPGGGEAQDQWC